MVIFMDQAELKCAQIAVNFISGCVCENVSRRDQHLRQ